MSLETLPVNFGAIFAWVWDLLGETDDTLAEDVLSRYVQSAIDRLIDVYPALQSYDALYAAGGPDLRFFSEGVAHLVAARLRPARAKNVITGEQVFRLAGDQEERFSAPASSKTMLEDGWMNAALVALGRVSAIKAVTLARAASPSRFLVTGPTRTARENGYTPTLLSGVLREISEDTADTIEAGLSDDALSR